MENAEDKQFSFRLDEVLKIGKIENDDKEKDFHILEKIAGKNGRVPDFVFLAHVVDMSSALHAPFVNRSMASLPYYTRIYMLPFLPFTFTVMLLMWAKSKTFLISFYNLRNRLHQTWAVPRFGFQVLEFDSVLIFTSSFSNVLE